MKKILSIICLSLVLMGCEESYTVEQLKNDPELMQKVNLECREMAQKDSAKMLEEPKCKVMMAAMEALVQEKLKEVGLIINGSLEKTADEMNLAAEEMSKALNDASADLNAYMQE